MPLKEHVYSVLIVSSSEKFNSSLLALLQGSGCSPIHIASSVSSAQRKILERDYDLVLINTPLSDDFGRKFAIDVSGNKNAVAMLFVKSELYDEIYSKVVDHGVFTIKKPTSTQMISQALDWMRSTRERLRRLEKKTISIQEKMEEIRIVNRAKWALIDSCKMTESDAHRYIEKQAMNRCITRREVAENILKTYS